MKRVIDSNNLLLLPQTYHDDSILASELTQKLKEIPIKLSIDLTFGHLP